MVDIAACLSSLPFESFLTDDEKKLLYLRARAAGLTFCGCAHTAFTCDLVHSLRGLHVEILGMGHLGEQLLLFLLKTRINPLHIKVSTRRPELAVLLLKFS
ncbi:LOW QUALITY PROTEIN: NADP-dependent oxidoreductase domain-containing protein 1 [Pholidichthys leucotaenia]